MESQKWYKNPEMIVALSALLIGLVTACTSIYSAYVDREYAKASVWPRLEIFRSYNGESLSYGVTNNGTGPALIQYAKVKSNDDYVKTWKEIDGFESFTQSHISTRTLSPQASATPVAYRGKKAANFAAADQAIHIELCYCSIYQQCWVIDRENQPQPVAVCAVSPEQQFLQ